MSPVDWIATAENINKLPDPVRRYIHDLETRCDPAGELRILVLCQDTVRQLAARLAEVERERERETRVWREKVRFLGDVAGRAESALHAAQAELAEAKREIAGWNRVADFAEKLEGHGVR
jgi:hypothetical protein